MESFKRYLPWIIVAIVGLFLIRKLSSQTRLAPQTQFTESQQVDQFAESRASAFEGLLQVVGLEIGEEGETERAESAGEVAARAQRFQFDLGLKGLETDLSRTKILADASARAAEFDFLSRENDRQIQQGAIDRYYSSRNTGNIISSVSQALSSFFNRNNRSGGVFTPPTFPRSGGFI